jgi:hypothetical protein
MKSVTLTVGAEDPDAADEEADPGVEAGVAAFAARAI